MDEDVDVDLDVGVDVGVDVIGLEYLFQVVGKVMEWWSGGVSD